MRIKFVILVVIMFSSFVCNGADNVEGLMNNPRELSEKIVVLESLINKETKSEQQKELENLKWNLVNIQNNVLNLQKDKSIIDAIHYAGEKGWVNTSSALQSLKDTCSVFNKMGNECMVEISEFEIFIDSRRIANAEKVKFKTLIEDYQSYIQAKLIVNDNLIQSINYSLMKFKSIIDKPLRPLARIKLSTPSLIVVKKVSTEESVFFKLHNKINYLYSEILTIKNLDSISVMSLMLILITYFVRIFYIKRMALKDISNFYKIIFYQGHKYKTKTKIFGTIGVCDFKKLNHIKNSYIRFIELLGPFKNAIDIKFKKKNKAFIIETLLYTSIPMQQYLNSENHESFLQGVTKLNESASQISGKVFITNSFDQSGNIVSSKLIISL